MLIYCLIGICVLFFIVSVIFIYKYMNCNKELNTIKRDICSKSSKVSMLEYACRSYVEQNTNPYTVMRDILNILRSE